MNEVFLDDYYGREHVRELLQEAEQERLASTAKGTSAVNRGFRRVRKFVSKAVSNIID